MHEDPDLGVVEPIRQWPRVQTLPVWSVTSSGPFGPGQGEADQKADPDLDLFHRLSTRAIPTQMQNSRMSKTILMKPVFCFFFTLTSQKVDLVALKYLIGDATVLAISIMSYLGFRV